jgi:hypothetical protein
VSVLAVLALVVAWLGASLTALSEARRGLALGLVFTGTGLAGITLTGPAVAARPLGAILLAAAALVAALLRLRDGAAGWGVLPAGSTPGIVLSVAVLAASLLLAGTVLGGSQAVTIAGSLAVALISTLRLLSSPRRQIALATGSALALALGALGGTADAVAGSLVAVALAAIPSSEPEEVPG